MVTYFNVYLIFRNYLKRKRKSYVKCEKAYRVWLKISSFDLGFYLYEEVQAWLENLQKMKA